MYNVVQGLPNPRISWARGGGSLAGAVGAGSGLSLRLERVDRYRLVTPSHRWQCKDEISGKFKQVPCSRINIILIS